MAIVLLVSIVFTLKVKNFRNSFYKLRQGIIYKLVLVGNVCYKYEIAAKHRGLNTEL